MQLSGDLKLPTRGNTGAMEKSANATNQSFFIQRANRKTFTSTQPRGKELWFQEVGELGGCEGRNCLYCPERAVSRSGE